MTGLVAASGEGSDRPAVKIVAMERRHLSSAMTSDALVYPKPWSKRLWIQELDRGDRLYLCATVGRSVLGHIGVLISGDDAHVMTVVTHPRYQRQQVASRLLLHVIPLASARGCSALTLEVRSSNTAAQALYRRFGLAPVGVRKAYYEPEGEDALVMWAHDIDGDPYRARLAALAADLEVAA
jgi:ribosomal-protein-alanine N-acetyltransferase